MARSSSRRASGSPASFLSPSWNRRAVSPGSNCSRCTQCRSLREVRRTSSSSAARHWSTSRRRSQERRSTGLRQTTAASGYCSLTGNAAWGRSPKAARIRARSPTSSTTSVGQGRMRSSPTGRRTSSTRGCATCSAGPAGPSSRTRSRSRPTPPSGRARCRPSSARASATTSCRSSPYSSRSTSATPSSSTTSRATESATTSTSS